MRKIVLALGLLTASYQLVAAKEWRNEIRESPASLLFGKTLCHIEARYLFGSGIVEATLNPTSIFGKPQFVVRFEDRSGRNLPLRCVAVRAVPGGDLLAVSRGRDGETAVPMKSIFENEIPEAEDDAYFADGGEAFAVEGEALRLLLRQIDTATVLSVSVEIDLAGFSSGVANFSIDESWPEAREDCRKAQGQGWFERWRHRTWETGR